VDALAGGFPAGRIEKADFMAKLTGLIKTIIGAAIFRKAMKGAFTIALVKSMNLLKSKPSGNSPGILQSILKGLLALTLLKSMKKSWMAEPAVISTIAALLLAMMKPRESAHGSASSASRSGGRKDRVIDVNDYTVVEEKF
jgi:uncharacterized membrane protein HdeD (DUF308 family)